MNNSLLIKNATLVNEGKIFKSDVYVENGIIQRIAENIDQECEQVIDAAGKHLLPGMIDDQVHFREPGLDYKGNIYTESRAAAAGGVTSYMEMPNTNPQATTIEILEEKYKIAEKNSLVNYSFYLGGTNDNIEEIKKIDPKNICGLKVFMGSSTGNMLVDNPETLEQIFKESPVIILTHCEDTPMIRQNEIEYEKKYGKDMPIGYHAEIRSAEACYRSSSMAMELAKKHGARLHILHLSTAKELELFEAGPLENKKITGEVCVHHLTFEHADYETHGTKIKWNPAVKYKEDRDALRKALNDDVLDVLATDHAPHLESEKDNSYWKAPSGGPLVQHVVQAALELYHEGVFSLEKIVDKACHASAKLFQVEKRGFLREGYFADLVLVDLNKPYTVTRDNILYKCKWSPFEGKTFKSTIETTIVNGNIVYNDGKLVDETTGSRLTFDR